MLVRHLKAIDLILPFLLVVIGLSLVTFQDSPIEQIVQGAIVIACLILIVALRTQLWALAGQPTASLLLAALGTHLAIGSIVAIVNSQPDVLNEIARQVYHFVIVTAITVAMASALRTEKTERLLIRCLAVLSTGCLIVVLSPLLIRLGILADFHPSRRMTGLFSDPNDAGLLAAFTAALSLAMLLHAAYKKTACTGLALALLAAFLSVSYTAILILGVTLLVALVKAKSLRRSVPLLTTIGSAIAVVAVALFLIITSFDFARLADLLPQDNQVEQDDAEGTPESTELAETIASASDLRQSEFTFLDSAQDRIDLWQIGLETALDQPLYGFGLGNVGSPHTGAGVVESDSFVGVHNLYLLLVVQAGLLPLLLYLGFLAQIVSASRRAGPSLAKDALLLTVPLIILYGMVFHHLTYFALFLVIFGISAGLSDRLLASSPLPAKDQLVSLATARRLAAPVVYDVRHAGSSPRVVLPFLLIIVASSLVTLSGPVSTPLAQGATFVACLVVILSTRSHLRRLWRLPLTRSVLSALGAYLVIGSASSLASSGAIGWLDIAGQACDTAVFAAVALGATSLIRSGRPERLLLPCLGVLAAGCTVILLTPTLVSLRLLPEPGDPARWAGTFLDPSDAGLLAALTTVLAIAVLLQHYDNADYRRRGYTGLAVALGAVFATFSYTAAVVAGIAVVCGLVLSLRRDATRALQITLAALASLIGAYLALSLTSLYLTWYTLAYAALAVAGAATAVALTTYWLGSPRSMQVATGGIVLLAGVYGALTALDLVKFDPFAGPQTSGVFRSELIGLYPGGGYDVRAWPALGDWAGAPVESSEVADSEGVIDWSWEDPNSYLVRYGNDTDGWSDWRQPEELFDQALEGALALGVSRDTDVQMRPADDPNAIPSGLFRYETDDQALVLLQWPQWKFQIRGARDDQWRRIRRFSPRKLDPAGSATEDEPLYPDVNLTCIDPTGCHQLPSIALTLLRIPPVATLPGVFRSELIGLYPGGGYDVRAWPALGDWAGAPVESSEVADSEGVIDWSWEDPNSYLVRYGNDTDGWSDWRQPEELFDQALEGALALGVSRDTDVQMRPADDPNAIPSGLFRYETDDQALVLLQWPQWKFQIRGARDDQWRRIRRFSPRKLDPTVAASEYDPLDLEVNLECVDQSGCDQLRIVALGEPETEVLAEAGSGDDSLDESSTDAHRTASDDIARRLDLWGEGLEVAADNPLFGAGYVRGEFDSAQAADSEPERPGAHNLYISLVSEAGALPLILYLFFLYGICKTVLARTPSFTRDFLALSLVLIAGYGMAFHHLASLPLFMVILGLTAALADSLAVPVVPAWGTRMALATRQRLFGSRSAVEYSSSDVQRLVRSYLASFEGRDPEAIAAHVSKGFVNRNTSPLGAGSDGRDAYRERLTEFLGAMPGLAYTVERLVVGDAGHVAVFYLLSADGPDGRPVEVRGVQHLVVADGEIVSRTDYFDTVVYLLQADPEALRDLGLERSLEA